MTTIPAPGRYDRMILMVFYLESKYGKDWADPATSTLNYDADQIAEGIDFIKSLVEGHVIMSLPTYYGSNGDNAAHQSTEWITGKLAGCFEWDSSATKYADALDEENKAGFTVGEEIKFGDYNGGFSKVSMGLAITKTCEHPAEAATLINFLLNETTGAEIMGSECGIPASKLVWLLLRAPARSRSWWLRQTARSWPSFPTSSTPCSSPTT